MLPDAMLGDRERAVGRRKLYGRPDGVEEVFKPKRRVLRPKESEVVAQTGKRYIEPPTCDKLLRHPERLHNATAQMRSGFDNEESLAWACKGRGGQDMPAAEEMLVSG